MLLFRAKPPANWIDHIRGHIDRVLLDHAHLERKAATSAITLEKYRPLWPKVEELNAIALEELEHFQLVMDLLKKRNIPYGPSPNSPWITGLMQSIRRGQFEQVIDHLVCASLIEGRSCEKFQMLAEAFVHDDPELADFYASLVESEGNHYATYLIMAREIDEAETRRRLDAFLDVEAELIQRPNPLPMLH